jgi:cell wall-associated NlpC family hydrolase
MRRTHPAGVAAAFLVAALVITIGATSAAAAPTFPSWGEVQKSKHSVAGKKAEIRKLTGLIASLQSQSAAAGTVALVRGEQYLEAKNALDAATAATKRLAAQATVAQKKASASRLEAGVLAAQLARTGGGDLSLSLLMNSHDASDLLDVLGTMDKLGDASAVIFAQAQQDRNTATALSRQARVAEKARARRATKAASTLAAAKSASNHARSRVTVQNRQQTILTAQLASLRGTSKKVEAAYYAGVAWEKKQAAKKTPPPDPVVPPGSASGGAPGGASGGAPGGAPGSNPSPPPGPPSGSAVTTAINFAKAQLGEPYVLDGMGPNIWDCSGLTKAAYAAAGVYIGTHSSTNQYDTMRADNRLVPLSQRQAGDLLWYSNGGSTSAIKYHVTLYIGNGEMIEAPYPGASVRIAAIRFGDLVPYAGRPTG